jgi:hypothetical protein
MQGLAHLDQGQITAAGNEAQSCLDGCNSTRDSCTSGCDANNNDSAGDTSGGDTSGGDDNN